MSARPLDLSVVIPAYNEEARLGATLERILAYLGERDLDFEVLVADDGSRDGTGAVATTFDGRGVHLLRAPHNQGKGAATQRGVLASRGRQVLLTDADLSTPIEDLAVLEPHLANAALVLGSRAVASSRLTRRQPLYRELMGKTFNKLIRLLGVGGLADTQCGFKLLDGAVARQVFAVLVTPGFAYDVELVWLTRYFGHRVVEVGVTWANSPDSRVRPLIDPALMIFEIFRFRWLHRSLPRGGNFPT